MSTLRLRQAENLVNPEVVCPHCDCALEVDTWNTEYGEPFDGTQTVRCSVCRKSFEIEVEMRASYYVIPLKKKP